MEVDQAGGAPAPSRCTCQAWLVGPESRGRWLLRPRRRAAAAAQLPVALVGCTTYSECSGWQTYDTVLTKYDLMVLKARERGVRPPSPPSYKWDREDAGRHARALPSCRPQAPPAPPANCSWRRPRAEHGAEAARLVEVHQLVEAVDLAALVRHVCSA